MTTSQAYGPIAPVLHVFEQAGGWHWGITIPRARGSGFKLIAFSEKTFLTENAARRDGRQALVNLAGSGTCGPLVTESAGEQLL
ncbi:hypothetical protein [Paraburkholderia terricola]|uniref:Uncharacterized protein n=1 Tax=Paraburkholderia terricola TaxID=169427 RepID=A0A1M6WQ03_9BURK|nr:MULTISPECIES: hypothetical protein [Paraburkholderia]AXE94643.1 hypothetical protein CUJ90_19675 [Paraburkholderia terricola]SDP11594.1 hypothetical protein SAMN05192547_104237 [Paraburkholderia sediminicola]SHK95850.1 hypothetical protein SAMN05192548_104815 [Paraburkholderia terricola]